ncbi:hypothetical protein BDY19DRAFT_996264, partial [Irpex rosettiformis]
QKNILRRHLLTPLYSGDVVIAGQRDNTHTLLRRGASVPKGTLYPTVHEDVSLTATTIPEDEPLAPQGTGIIASRTEKLLKLITLHDKSHHRIVFAEVAITIEDIRSAKMVFDIARQATTALKAIHECGWVHRDISSGNILIVDNIAKISDLEYAKKMNDKSSHSERSGTLFFMSIEARVHRYLFRPRNKERALKQARERPNHRNATKTENTHSKVPIPLRYNPLHDLESLWWVLVYLLLRRPAVIEDTMERRKEQIEFYDQLFTGTTNHRQLVFQSEVEFQQGRAKLHPRLKPIADSLAWARRLLVVQYEEAEAQDEDILKIDHTVGDEIASLLIGEFKTVVDEFTRDNQDIKLSRLRPPRNKNISPEQPGAAVAIGTSLDSREEDSSKKRRYADTAESTVVDYRGLQEEKKRVKLVEEQRKEQKKQQQGKSEECVSQSSDSAKGKGKAKEVFESSDVDSQDSEDDLYA